jgi:hypothetical protein
MRSPGMAGMGTKVPRPGVEPSLVKDRSADDMAAETAPALGARAAGIAGSHNGASGAVTGVARRLNAGEHRASQADRRASGESRAGSGTVDAHRLPRLSSGLHANGPGPLPDAAPGAPVTESVPLPSSLASVKRLIAHGNGTGMDTSEGVLFNHTIWGRDGVITALDVLHARPAVARQTILTLARLQGTRDHLRSEEEVGKIHNEHRDLVLFDGPLAVRALFRYVLSPLWGGDLRSYTTYFAADSTPLYIILVRRYAELDPAILDQVVQQANGGRVSVRQSVALAARWIVGHLGPEGLVEVPKRNPLSLPSQTWRDSPTSNLDQRGRSTNTACPVAYLDVQVLSAEALLDAAALLGEKPDINGVLPPDQKAAGAASERKADELTAKAQRLREATLRHFWMEESSYFAFARDRDAAGQPRLLTAVQSNAGWLLASRIFDALPAEQRAGYVSGIVRTLFAPDMLTVAGIRGRSLRYSNRSFRNYHEHVWPMDTFMIAKGLRRQGLPKLAEQLEIRLVNAANLLGANWEFIAVDDAGRIVDPTLRREEARRRSAAAAPLYTEMLPERNLAWSVTAMLRIKRERAARFRGGEPAAAAVPQEPWQAALTAEILAAIPVLPVLRSRAELAPLRAQISPLYLHHYGGLLRSARLLAGNGFAGMVARQLAREARSLATTPQRPRRAALTSSPSLRLVVPRRVTDGRPAAP